MTGIGRDDHGLRLEHELRAAAPQARALFVDEVARRLQSQRFRMRPTRARMGLALSFSMLMVVALGVLGAPGYAARAATAIVNTATSSLGGGSSSPTAQGAATTGASSGTDQYAILHGICDRGPNNQFTMLFVGAGDLDTHAAKGDIIPAPPWGCPGNERVSSTTTRRTTTLIAVDGPATVKILKRVDFTLTLTAAGGSVPRGTGSCVDDLHRCAASVPGGTGRRG